jgi:hypothetical protein
MVMNPANPGECQDDLVLSDLTLGARAGISLQSLAVEAPGWQGAKVLEYLDIPSFRNAARWDASAAKM